MVQNLLQQAGELIGIGKFKKALKIVDKALAIDNNNAEGWYLRGKCFTAMGKELDAAYCYRKLKEVGGNPLLAFSNLVRSITSVDDKGELKKPKRKYIDPDSISSNIIFPDAETWVQQGTASQRVGMYETALACYFRALHKNPNYEPALRNKQQLLKLMGWEDGEPWELFVKNVLSDLDPVEKEALLKLRNQTKFGVQLEEKITQVPDTSYDKKISVEIEENKVVGIGIFHILDDLPPYLSDLKHLTTFYCNGGMTRNQISTIPEEFRNLKHLKKIGMKSNKLTTLPDWLGELAEVEWLNFQSNKINRIPDSITNLTKLRTLDVRYNEITSLPEDLGNCSELWWLDIGFNALTEVPSSLSKLKKLYTLKISNNKFTSTPELVKVLQNKGVKVEYEDSLF